jgi:hypothetical protein
MENSNTRGNTPAMVATTTVPKESFRGDPANVVTPHQARCRRWHQSRAPFGGRGSRRGHPSHDAGAYGSSSLYDALHGAVRGVVQPHRMRARVAYRVLVNTVANRRCEKHDNQKPRYADVFTEPFYGFTLCGLAARLGGVGGILPLALDCLRLRQDGFLAVVVTWLVVGHLNAPFLGRAALVVSAHEMRSLLLITLAGAVVLEQLRPSSDAFVLRQIVVVIHGVQK